MPSSLTLAAQAPASPPQADAGIGRDSRSTAAPAAGLAPTSSPSSASGLAGPAEWRIEPLRGWHLPLLEDPAFLPLQPLLQRSLLLAVPERLISTLRGGQPLAAQALVAVHQQPGGPQRAIGLIVCRRLNRSGSSWQIEHLRLAMASGEGAGRPSRRDLASALVREAIRRTRAATSWFASCSSLDSARLSLLREQGFQPQRNDLLWRWRPGPGSPITLPAGLQLLPLQRRTAGLLWHLEQAACPAQLRQLLDRRTEDLLDQSGSRGWMLIDVCRREAVAGLRWLADHPEGGERVAFTLHPGWSQLLGAPSELLLRQATHGQAPLWLTSEATDTARRDWLVQLGAEPMQEEVLMARSVWRRQAHPQRPAGVARLEAMLDHLQPRRRPLPSPVSRLPLR